MEMKCPWSYLQLRFYFGQSIRSKQIWKENFFDSFESAVWTGTKETSRHKWKKKTQSILLSFFFFSFLFFLLQMEITALVRLQRGQCGQVSSGLAGQKNICLQSTARPPHLCFSPEASPRLALITPFPKLTHTLVTVFFLSLSPSLNHILVCVTAQCFRSRIISLGSSTTYLYSW